MKTLSTTKQKLGLDYDEYIKKILICDKCYKNYTYEDIEKLTSPSCTVKECKGKVHRVKNTTTIKGDKTGLVEERKPTKILPCISLIKGLCWMLTRPSWWIIWSLSEISRNHLMKIHGCSTVKTALLLKLEKLASNELLMTIG